MMRISTEGMGGQWSEAFSLDDIGTKVRVIEFKGEKVVLFIRIKQLTNIQKQVSVIKSQVKTLFYCSLIIISLNSLLCQHVGDCQRPSMCLQSPERAIRGPLVDFQQNPNIQRVHQYITFI